LEEEVARHRRQLTSMSVRAVDLQQELHEIDENLAAAQHDHREVARRLAEEERGLTKLTAQLDALRSENEQRRAAHLGQMRAGAALASQVSGLEAKAASTEAVRERGGKRLAELTAAREALAEQLVALRDAAGRVAEACAERHAQLDQLQASLARHRAEAEEAQQAVAHLRERASRAGERASVLEELEKRLEGVTAGVKQLLVEAREAGEGPLKQIRGLVADLVHVNFENAAVVEAALGEMAQCLVVDDGRQWIAHLQQAPPLAGRVGFVRLDAAAAKTHLDAIDLDGQPGVVGRADRFVETAPDFAALARRLLGRTWIVESLDHALALAESAGRGLSFVTCAGELLTADGTLHAGPRHASTGLISRRSELRVLARQIGELTGQIASRESVCTRLAAEIAEEDRRAKALAAEHRQLSGQLAEERSRVTAAEERSAQLEQQATAVESELAAAENDHQRAAAALVETRASLAKVTAAVAELEAGIEEGARQANQLEQARQRFGREAGATKIEVVKSEQRLAHLGSRRSQVQRDQQERGRALADSRSHLEVCLERLRDAERNVLAAESEVAELYLRKEAFAAEAVRHVEQREGWRERRSQLAAEAQRVRARIRKLEAKLHAKELAAGEVRHERTTLADRLREDYQIELADLEHEPSAEELQERTAAEREIADLRAKLNSIGGVNLDALAELEELETRYNTLSAQHKDLASAKASLESIIERINADSRRLFSDTLEVVREHFESLFRKLFGGGHADIVLDEGVDILDSGIEIIARPPGKEPRNISLLSGGEKTLTCVALLLAIFRSRPSPFCVLDEVDAALDEANIERFIGVLQEFLAWTQFIVVTHSKKTMTCASTLYGITMQESGISKRVSVRFEDVSETGEILNVRESEQPAAEDETQAA
jgi:chromosome segregation protein